MSDTKAQLAIVGTYTDSDEAGAYSFRVDRDDGSLAPLDSLVGGQDPSFLTVSPAGDTAYVVNETDDGTVRTVDIDRASGALTERARAPSGGDGPCYCSVHPSGEWLFVAHYAGGSISVLPIDEDGAAGDPTTVVEHEGSSADPERQTAAHPHAAVPSPDGQFLLVPDLGTDEVVSYAFDGEDGALRRQSSVEFPEGSGPRHLDFGPNGDVAYVITELDSTVATLDYDTESGALSLADRASTLPDDAPENLTADIHVHPAGEWVFGSNRGHDSIAALAVDEGDERLSPAGREPVRGRYPRSFDLSPSGEWLFVANKDTDAITTFAIDRSTAELSYADTVTGVPSPVCVRRCPGTRTE